MEILKNGVFMQELDINKSDGFSREGACSCQNVVTEEAFKDDVALSNAYCISKNKGVKIILL